MSDPAILRHEFAIGIDRFRGVDFERHVTASELGLNSNVQRGYQPSGGIHLRRILREISIQSSDRIIDIGCGKGSALREMTRFPFARIAGIEIADELIKIAEQNFKKLEISGIEFISGDASEYEGYGNFNIFYLYNSFSGEIMGKFLDKLESSLLGTEERKLLIYNNPVCHDQIVRSGIIELLSVRADRWRKGIHVYSSIQ